MWCPPVTQLNALTTVSIAAQGAPADGGGGAPAFDPFLLIMLAVFGLLIFSMFRRSKKAQQQQRELHNTLGPGVEVMTTMGLFGTILSVDKDQNKAVIELSPGTTATVHLQAIGKAVEPAAPAAGAPADETPVVPDSPAGLEDRGTESEPERAEGTTGIEGTGPDEQRPGTDRPSA
jgi:preprotein translocase subunit YajC